MIDILADPTQPEPYPCASPITSATARLNTTNAWQMEVDRAEIGLDFC